MPRLRLSNEPITSQTPSRCTTCFAAESEIRFIEKRFDRQEYIYRPLANAYILDYHPAELDIVGIPSSSVYRKLN